MGIGKRSGPGERITGKGLTETEVYAELVHNGVTLAEIAGLADRQIKELYFRTRDEHGRLKSVSVDWDEKETECPKTAEWKRSSFTEMFRERLRNFGKTEEEIDARWKEYINLPKNRSLKKKLEWNELIRRRIAETRG